jgi:hypothetical protein
LVPPDAGYDYSSYWVEVYQAELDEFPELFNVVLGAPLGARTSPSYKLWRRDFEGGRVYVNAHTTISRNVSLGRTMLDIDGNAVTSISLAPQKAAILTIPGFLSDGDLNQDCEVDFIDFAFFAQNWLESSCGPDDWCNGADMNRSGEVDIEDLSDWIQDWLN